MGCSTAFALLFPIWMLVTASVLQVTPWLRGDDIRDPLTNMVTFQEYSLLTQWARGGLVSTAMLLATTPIFLQALFLVFAASRMAGASNRRESRRYQAAVGPVASTATLTVRKRMKSGQVVDAIPVTVVDASPLRRLLAQLMDLVLLVLSMIGGGMIGTVMGLATVDAHDRLDLATPIGAAVLGLVTLAVQWVASHSNGQSLGKMLVEIHAEQRGGEPLTTSAHLLRNVLPELITYGLALGVVLLGQLQLQGLFGEQVLPWVWMIVPFLAFPPIFLGLTALRGVPLLFGSRGSVNDGWSGTRVVRSSLGEPPPDDVPAFVRRAGARLVDMLLVGVIPASILLLAFRLEDGVLSWVGWWPIVIAVGLYATLRTGVVVGGALLGQTPGKKLFGLRIVDEEGAAPGISTLLVREWVGIDLVWLIAPIGPVIDVGSALGDEARAGHDWLVGTRVVSTR